MKKIVLIGAGFVGILLLVVLMSRKDSGNQIQKIEPVLVEQNFERQDDRPVDDLSGNAAPVLRNHYPSMIRFPLPC